MFKTLAAVSVLASLAIAADIPAAASEECKTFLTSLNTNTEIQSCLAPLAKATEAYGAGASGTVSSSALTSALGALCATDMCDNVIRSQLASFYSACTPELTGGNQEVLTLYDTLYVLAPFKNATCTKGDGGDYCVTAQTAVSGVNVNLAAGAASGALTPSILQQYLYTTSAKRAESSISVNTTTFSASNLVFLFLKPTLETADLCTSCTRSVLRAYINFESNVPYGPGLAASPLLSGQNDLLDGVKATCGSSFLQGTVNAAGGLSGGLLSNDEEEKNSASRTAFSTVSMMVLFGLGAVALL